MSGRFTTLTNSGNDLRRDTSYGNGWLEEHGFSLEVEIWRTGSLLDVFSFVSSLLLFFGSQPGTNGIGTGFYHQPMEVEFPRAPDPPKGRHELYRSVVGLMGSYDCVRRMIVSFFVSLSFSSLILALAAQEVCA